MLIPLGIYLIVPLLGFSLWLWLCRALQRKAISLRAEYFVLFAIYGGWLLVALTSLFWEWSGVASLGFFGLMFIAPFVTAAIAKSLRTHREVSVHHKVVFYMSATYTVLGLTLLALFVTNSFARFVR